MEIRQLTKNDAEVYQKIRLEALQNNPEAFASSFEEECEHPIDKYIMRFQSDNSFTFGAFEKDKLVGVITLVKETLNKLSHRANIVAMYVSPCNRGLGIGKDLIKKAIKQKNWKD
ncbi:GNAT family N-acetyltransferase [Sporosarcina aquimarina]|uniref:GNAT family N-acetyltransferase n=1 Tax=Sporosarcina aquimarina TaxID=114975 RepID=UPI00295EFC58|nr:GNAT family N-acetyltransferase [Sporosarcina aquimarina]